MVGLDWLDLDFFFHHFFQGSVPKFWGRSQNLSSADQGCAWAPAPAPGPAPWGPMGPHGALWGPMGPHGPTVPLRECRRQFTLEL